LMDYTEAESDSLVHAHFAPSCGTCSRAREIRVPGLPVGLPATERIASW
jgi:hypothetical protein